MSEPTVAAEQTKVITSQGLRPGGRSKREVLVPTGYNRTHAVDEDGNTTVCGRPLEGLHRLDVVFRTINPGLKCKQCEELVAHPPT